MRGNRLVSLVKGRFGEEESTRSQRFRANAKKELLMSLHILTRTNIAAYA